MRWPEKSIKEFINKEYDQRIEKIKNGTFIFDSETPIDLNDPKQVAIAFYSLGQKEIVEDKQKEREIYESIIRNLIKKVNLLEKETSE